MDSKTQSREGKKAYRTPRVKSYGDIRQITQGASNNGNRDASASGPKRGAYFFGSIPFASFPIIRSSLAPNSSR